MGTLEAIELAAQLAALALKIGQDALPFVQLIQSWAKKDTQPTQADFDDLQAKKKVFLDILNDTLRDVE